MIYRELTGGIYFGEKYLSEDGNTASDLCLYTRVEIERIAKMAFKAAQNRRKKLTLIDKANVLESSRLWRKVVSEMSANFPDVTLDFLFVDNAAMQMILNPSQFDVILTENLFGDVISDEGSVIGGSIGLLASASVGDQFAMFEPIHGSFPQGAGKDIANPIARYFICLYVVGTFLECLKKPNVFQKAVDKALESNVTTSDLNPSSTYGTNAVGDYIAESIAKN